MNVVTNNASTIRLACDTCGTHRKFTWTTYDGMEDHERVQCPVCGVASEIVTTAETDLLVRVG